MSSSKVKKNIKEIIHPIILNQGNAFIKELLRKHGAPIGATKEDFSKNLMAAIDDGTLTQELIEEWLGEVEGWGNQHIYLHEPLEIKRATIEKKIKNSNFSSLLDKKNYKFPKTLSLTTITVTPKTLTLVWQIGNSSWTRVKHKDHQKEEGDDLYEYRAFRQKFDRNIVRFEWDFSNPYCALLIQLPNEDDLHKNAIAKIHKDLMEIGLIDSPLKRINISKAIKALTRNPDVVVRSTKMAASGGHVELVSTLSSGGIDKVAAVREVRRSVEDKNFSSADGTFNFENDKYDKLSRSLKVQGYGSESRIRIWVQCKRDDVYFLLDLVWAELKKK